MRAPGIEPGQRAWKALIIASRSHPQIKGENTVFVFVFYYTNEIPVIDNLLKIFLYKKRYEIPYLFNFEN